MGSYPQDERGVISMSSRTLLFSAALALLASLSNSQGQLQADQDTVEFVRDVRPILADKCYRCHGPDEKQRQADLRLDTRVGAFAKRRGVAVIVAGDPDASELLRRVFHSDPEERMPPAAAKVFLSEEEKTTLRRWVESGAQWQEHWAFVPPRRPELPEPAVEGQARGAIDRFVERRLRRDGLRPAAQADRETLLRRVTLDLTGLSPTPQEADAFFADASPDAYERLVDRLLASPAFGERMALEWMDVARYADSHGMHADGWRRMWPWRDWVIGAFQRNVPYDEFVTLQLAGDLLPEADREEILATAFHRNHAMTAEGGAVDEEWRLLYVADRAQTTATAFLGLTLQCARCHDHKFDPLSQKEYYQFTAFFNNVKELGMTGDDGDYGPLLLLPDEEDDARLSALAEHKTELEKQVERLREVTTRTVSDATLAGYQGAAPPEPAYHFPFEISGDVKLADGTTGLRFDGSPLAAPTGEPTLVEGRVGQGIDFDNEYDIVSISDAGLFEMTDRYAVAIWLRPEVLGRPQAIAGTSGAKNELWRGWELELDPEGRPELRLIHGLPQNYLHVRADDPVELSEWTHLAFSYDGSGRAGGVRLYVDGEPASTTVVYDRLYKSIHPVIHSVGFERTNRPIRLGKSHRRFGGDNGVYRGSLDDLRVYHDMLTAPEVRTLYESMFPANAAPRPGAMARADLLEHHVVRQVFETEPAAQELVRDLDRVRREHLAVIDSIPEVMVMEEMAVPRPTHILNRGAYDAPGETVEAGTPESILGFPAKLPLNRLGLAQWLFDAENPLTARVTVNRYWQLIFGRGIVKTSEDFGVQGETPTHPELLDWLAVSFRASGWDLKALLRQLVLSGTYRRSSNPSPDHLRKDPDNRLLARGPSYRLPAELIRDRALASSGLLVRSIGGASVKPYQPAGLWIEKGNFSKYLLNYVPDTGAKLYRRSLYTFIRRTSPHPSMVAFDAPTRNSCTVRRETTNTPLQALVLMNDPQFVEAARVLAARLETEGGAAVKERLVYAFRLVLGRYPQEREVEILERLYATELARFEGDAAAAQGVLGVGEYPQAGGSTPAVTAALAVVANTLLNHDEFYTKR